MAVSLTIAEIAAELSAEVDGDATVAISGLAGIRDAGPGDITFIHSAKYAKDAATTMASAVIVKRDWKHECPAALLRVDDPDQAFAVVAEHYAPQVVTPQPGIHDSAIVSSEAELGANVSIGPLCVVEPGARVGSGSVIHAGSYVGHGAGLGEGCIIYQHVMIRERCVLGDRNIIHSGTVIGSDGFGYVVDAEGVRTKVPQTGIVQTGNDVEIGANVTIDRARFGKTLLGHGVKIDNLVQVAHNVVIGDNAVIVAQVGLAGSCEVGPYAILAGQVGVAGHLKIGEGAICGSQSGIARDVPDKTHVFGYPAIPQREFMKLHRMYLKQPQLREKVADLEKRIADLER